MIYFIYDDYEAEYITFVTIRYRIDFIEIYNGKIILKYNQTNELTWFNSHRTVGANYEERLGWILSPIV